MPLLRLPFFDAVLRIGSDSLVWNRADRAQSSRPSSAHADGKMTTRRDLRALGDPASDYTSNDKIGGHDGFTRLWTYGRPLKRSHRVLAA